MPKTNLSGTSRAAAACGAFVAMIGILVLIGWVADIAALRVLIPGSNPMVPSTATAFLLGAVALWLSLRPTLRARHYPRAALGLAITAMGALILADYALGLGLGYERILYRASAAPATGSMAVPTALGFFFTGLALSMIDARTRRGRVPSEVLALVATLFPLLSLVGRLYGVESFSNLMGGTVVMALPTATAFILLCAGIIVARPHGGVMRMLADRGAAGVVVRRLLPAAAIALLALGWARLLGERSGLYPTGVGVALYGVSSVLLLTALIWRNASMLRRMDAQRVASEERFASVAEAALDGIVVATDDGRIRFFNRGAERLFGYVRAEVEGRPISMLMPERFRSDHGEGLRRFVATGEPRILGRTVEVAGLTKDGTEFPLDISLSSWTSGDQIFFGAIIRDITERKMAEEALQEREAQIRAVLSGIGDAVVTTDLDGKVLSVNPALERLTGWRTQDVIGESYASVCPIVDATGRALTEDERFLPQAMKERRIVGSQSYDFKLRTRDGRLIPIAVTAAPIVDNDGDLIGGVDVLRDVSHESEVDQVKSSLISTVSHELRTPLTMIQGFSELIATRSMDRDQLVSAAGQINTASERLNRLIADLLSVSRIDSGRLEPRPRPLDLVELMTETSATFERPITIDAGAIPAVMADPDHVVQILTNLLSNAVKYSPEHAPIELTASSRDEAIDVSVADHGIGLSEDELAQVYTKFFRADRRDVREASGTGLGLYITKNLVEAQGGEIRVESDPGVGTTFTFTLRPATDAVERDPRASGGVDATVPQPVSVDRSGS